MFNKFIESVPLTSRDTKWDIMLSYHLGTGLRYAKALKECLEGFGYAVWIDYDALDADQSNVHAEMIKAITKCQVVILCISDGYENASSCREEYIHAHKLKKSIMPVLVDRNKASENSRLADVLAGKRYYHLYEDVDKTVSKMLRFLRGEISV